MFTNPVFMLTSPIRSFAFPLIICLFIIVVSLLLVSVGIVLYFSSLYINIHVYCMPIAYNKWIVIIAVLLCFIVFYVVAFIVNCRLKNGRTSRKAAFLLVFLWCMVIFTSFILIPLIPSTTETHMIFQIYSSYSSIRNSDKIFQYEFDDEKTHYHVISIECNSQERGDKSCNLVNAADICSTWGPILTMTHCKIYRCSFRI